MSINRVAPYRQWDYVSDADSTIRIVMKYIGNMPELNITHSRAGGESRACPHIYEVEK